MIINTGLRTDIPAYYSTWFYNRIREGYVLVRNPYYPQQVVKYRLAPEVVDCLIFCTKNPQPMFEKLHELDGFSQLWFVTITPYGKEIEPDVPDKEKVQDSFKRLSEKTGGHAVIWRYDPIFITERYTLESHIADFEKTAQNLSGYTESCVISFVDLYAKTCRNFPGIREVSKADRLKIGDEFSRIGKKYGILLRTCCEGVELERFGIDCSGCMTKFVVQHAIGSGLHIPKGKKSARDACDCLLNNDIGGYNTCGHGCLYCYANYDMDTVRHNMGLHDPKSPYLIGWAKKGDIIREARQESYLDQNLSFLPF